MSTDQQNKNQNLVSYIRTKKLLDDNILKNIFLKCQKDNFDLASVLIQQRLLPIEVLSSFLRTTTQYTTPQSSNVDIRLGATNKDFGKYTILQEIARGGMGIVYKAIQKDVNRVVALKIFTQNPQQKKRFFREAKATAMLQHPNIVPVYEVGNYNENIFFTMQYIEGCTLEQLLKKDNYFEKHYNQALKHCASIANALYFAHKNKIIHRDIKPSNILIDLENTAFLADFGLAKIIDSDSIALTQSGEILGTVFFMSPEQVQGQNVNHLSDIFSFGAMLYQILTLKMPFNGDNAISLYNKIAYDAPIPPTKHNPNVSKNLEKICLKCMNKEKKLRYQSAKALASDLDKVIAGENLHFFEIKNHLKKTSHWARKHILLILILCSLTITVLLLSQQLLSIDLRAQQEKELQQSEEFIAKHQYIKAGTILDGIIKNDKNCAEAYEKRSRVYYSLGEKNTAFDMISQAISLNPTPNFIQTKGDWLMQEQLYQEAIDIYRIVPEEKQQKEKIVEALLFLDKLDQALIIAKSLYEKQSSNQSNTVLLAKIYFKKQNYPKSLQLLQTTSSLSLKWQGEKHYYLGLIYSEQKNWELAVHNFQKVLTLGVFFDDLQLNLGRALSFCKEYQESAEHLQKAPDIHFVQHLQARNFHQLKQHDKAIYYYGKCIKNEPWQTNYYLKRSECYKAIGDIDKSIQDLLKVNHLDPYNIRPLSDLYLNLPRFHSIEKKYRLERIISHLLLMRYQDVKIDLFANQKYELTVKHVKNYNRNYKNIKSLQKDELQKFLDIISKNKSIGITNIAVAAIKRQYSNSEILSSIQNYLKTQNNNKSLRQLYAKMKTQNDIFQKKRAKQLLVRYYVLKDIEAIRSLFSIPSSIIASIASENSDTDIMRFFAVNAIAEMKTVEGFKLLEQMIQSPFSDMRLLSIVALKKQQAHAFVPPSIKISYPQTPFLRALYIQYLVSDTQQLRMLTRDMNPIVRLVAASKLWKAKELSVENIFAQSFISKNHFIRGYAHSIFWKHLHQHNKKTIAHITKKYLPQLIKAASDPNIEVKRIAIFCITGLKNVNVKNIIVPLFQRTSDEFIKVQILVALGVRGNIKTMVSFLKDKKSTYLQASLFVVSRVQSQSRMKSIALLEIIQETIKNPDSIFTPFILHSLGKSEMGGKFVYKYLDEDNEHVLLGSLLSLRQQGTLKNIPKMEKFLDHPNPKLRNAAIFSIIYICLRKNKTALMQKYHKISQQKNLQINAAYAYTKRLLNASDLGNVILKQKTADLNIIYPKHISNTYKYLKNHSKIYLQNQLLNFNKAVELAPENSSYLFHLGLLLYIDKKYKEALPLMEKANVMEQNPAYCFWLAHTYYQEKKYQFAFSTLQKCETFYFNDQKLAKLKFDILVALNQNKEALQAKERLRILQGQK